jgi:prevent-host-death family protein
MEVNVHHAKTHLSRLIQQAEAGEEVIIARAGKPAVKLVPVQPSAPKKFKAGALKGLFTVPDSFFDPDPELESLFYGGQILTGTPDEELIKVLPDHRETPADSK